MRNLPDEFEIPFVPANRRRDCSSASKAERNRIVDDGISSDVDDLLKGLGGLG